ncbi:MAG: hypothetical protein J6O40_03355 [Ruminococcus sp.]|nr:hypothetical protein [Ruminococcus sp.]
MGNVIRSDIYRLFRQKSLYIVMGIVALLNFAQGPILKIIYNLTKSIASEDNVAEIGEFMSEMKFSTILSEALGNVDTVLVLLVVIWFAYADLAHGYIKNIAGQLSRKGNIVVSKTAVTGFIFLIMMPFAVIFQVIGYSLVTKVTFDNITDGLIIFAVKYVCLVAIGAILLLIVVGAHSQVFGAVVAVLTGAGFLQLAYLGINSAIDKIFKTKNFDINEYMPDSVLHGNFVNDAGDLETTLLIKGVVSAAVVIAVITPITISIFNKKDVS